MSAILDQARARAEAKKIDGTEDEEIALRVGGQDLKFKGLQCLGG